MPIESPMDETKRIAADLVETVKKLQEQARKHTGRHTKALEALSTIFKGETNNLPEDTATQPNIHHTNQTGIHPPGTARVYTLSKPGTTPHV